MARRAASSSPALAGLRLRGYRSENRFLVFQVLPHTLGRVLSELDRQQVQSSWFLLYDRNPQTFVSNIFWAKPGDYPKAVQGIYHAPGQASFVELPSVTTP